jgi:glycosyltransferase involved in cell wall biosynthesis
VLRVRLLTRGSPTAVTGGHLYQRRMAEEAPRHGAVVEFAQSSLWMRPPLDADVVVVDSITAWRVGLGTLRRRARPPYVALVHQPPGGVGTGPIRRRIQAALDRFTYRRCAIVIVAGRPVAHQLVREHGVQASRVVVIEPGCDLPDAGQAPDLREGRRIAIVCVANWYRNKGIVELVDAVARLEPDHATLHLAGRDDVDPDHTALVRGRIAAPDVSDRVVVHGTLDRRGVAALYAGADVLALASRQETYSTVLAEALAASLPVVTWSAPHAEAVVTNGVEGLLVAPGDVGALAGALRALATDDGLRSALAEGARRRGATLPRWSDTAAAFFRVLRGSTTAAVEPPHDGSGGVDVDAADAGVLDEQPPGDRVGDAERPGERRLDGTDVGHDHHDARPCCG